VSLSEDIIFQNSKKRSEANRRRRRKQKTHQIVAPNIDAHLAIDNVYAEFFRKDNLDRPRFALGHLGK
jgi:hypothetical protein